MTNVYTLVNPQFRLRVTPDSAALLSFERQADALPLLRPREAATGWHPGESACFPMLPVANRVRDNRFTCNGREILLPGSPLDPHFFLHGDGWIQRWQLQTLGADRIVLGLRIQHECGFDYAARIVYRLMERGMAASLSLRHCGAEPMLYGAGFHPFFTLWRDTTLRFSASGYWSEDENHLPQEWCGMFPDEADFRRGKRPPHSWLNIGYSGWAGEAVMQTPSRNLCLRLRSQTPYLMLYQDGEGGFICLEPQSHPVDAHHMPGNPGLVMLGKGETLHFSMQILAEDIT